MKSLIIVFVFFLGFAQTLKAQQVSIFDNEGEARAYIDFDKNATIYMWDGTPVAFINNDGKDMCIIGFNGTFLGWYIEGIMYEKNGFIVGARKDALAMNTKSEKMKRIQRITPIRPFIPKSPVKPSLKTSWSGTTLAEFLFSGKK